MRFFLPPAAMTLCLGTVLCINALSYRRALHLLPSIYRRRPHLSCIYPDFVPLCRHFLPNETVTTIHLPFARARLNVLQAKSTGGSASAVRRLCEEIRRGRHTVCIALSKRLD
ncbi:hypothetical protein EXIGLDRAFT_434030 [Exidia glandulosa HHB12029]|uniref:Uncharacterized protein n=1 Tax=Exidia glandulosa HHB12029 TaxID=1314781 RepID=A0A165B9N3_EXIGL|nr:hypothetical protein EXIGLDRAFT_434030 [Exidia glandulosa HHB12029]